MFTGIIIFILILFFLVFFIIYKRGMIMKMFSLQASVPASELREELEKTADQVIRRLESQIAHLELLLDEADAKSELLAKQLKTAELVCLDEELLQQLTVKHYGENYLPVEIVHESPGNSETTASVLPRNIGETKDGIYGDKRQMILALSAQGYSVMEIAKATGLGKGEIILMLQLNKK
ncbi:MAG: hypothetical protein H6Q73_2493 [Firmicutes bacterium]|nr:hypothetical protein [Bacillota bacterium]